MTDVKIFCDKTYKQIVGLKAGLYDVLTKAETVSDSIHTDAFDQLKSLIAGIEAGLDELKNQCPSDWSPNKREIDDKMAEISKTLSHMADKLGTIVPHSAAWV
jgi:uncharacterized protein with von Willebrand factor type A (vWA) domain